ncbi:RNA polymerase sigma factor [Streptomyces longisporoflavus]|uniref:SigB/SigF/SigG family RNA polymerase sigma factor n=1 Tax=Streptomyces longisporoflavus TaxID=28044 RepID=UPI00167DB2D9|nr:SigB/SigF/SigG family RNA polymerase sigma factor [Streptomyces longisporoflavus]GGV66334.1 RNA polymerase sigma factor [Streptomyces longisporoflavus]
MTAQTTHRPSDADAPDTTAAFERLHALPEGAERQRLGAELVEAWLPMARRLAGKFRDRGEPLEDLEQVAALGLVKAVDRYDPARGPFAPYAVPTIVGEVKRYFRDHAWSVHVPRRIQELRNKVRAAVRELSLANGYRLPTLAQIAEHTQMSEEDVLAGMEAIDSFRAVSLDAQLGAGGFEGESPVLGELLGHSEPRYDTVVAREAVRPFLARLPERERRILYLRFFRDMTQAQIGEELGISQMHVSRLLSRACERVRRQIERDATDQRQPALAA